jgi:hypothetical protein
MYQTLPSFDDGFRGQIVPRRPFISARPLIAHTRRERRSLQN